MEKYKILVFCLGHNKGLIQVRVLKKLSEVPGITTLYVKGKFIAKFGVNAHRIDPLLSLIEKEKPSHVLGMASYRKDSRKIRFEQEFINKYGKSTIENDGPLKVFSNWRISPSKEYEKGYHSGSGPCNRVSYKILLGLSKLGSDTRYAFAHIPKTYNADDAVKIVEKIIVDEFI